MALVRPLPDELNPPSASEISTDRAEQLSLLENPQKEQLNQLRPDELNPPSANEISTDRAEQLSLLENPEKEQLHQLIPPLRRNIYLTSAKIALVFIFIIFYLTFCFVVHYRNVRVPVGPNGDMSLPFLHSTINIVSIITTMAILIVYVALWPMRDVIDEIRAEEFFRLMHAHPNGLPLNSINAVSATTTGAFDIFMATIHRHCSPLLSSTLAFSLLITGTSFIAPAALSVGSFCIDVDNSTFWIGSLQKDMFLVDSGPNGFNMAVINLPLASTMAWAEMFLNFTNGYYKVASSEGDQLEYLVPFPSAYTNTMKAYWTTDVIVLDPSCSWQTATIRAAGHLAWDVALSEYNFSVVLGNKSFVSTISESATGMVSVFVCNNDSSEFHVPVDGSVLFVIDQLDSFVESTKIPEDLAGFLSYGRTTVPVNLSSIPTLKFPSGDVLAFLLCSPHVSIQTRQVWATGNGNLTLGKPQRSPRNIDFRQANYLLSFILSDLSRNSGPTTNYGQLGTDLIVRLLFGEQSQLLPKMYEPAPLANITAVYKQVIHSAMKPFLSGGLAIESVPGGFIEEHMVFRSSSGHLFTSAIFFAFLMIALVAIQFRKRRVAFTFVNVAAALADSDVPQKCVGATQFMEGTGKRKVMKLFPSGDGQLNCAYQSIDQD